MHSLIAPTLALFYFLRPICLAARRLALAPNEAGLKVFGVTQRVPPVAVAVPKENVDD